MVKLLDFDGPIDATALAWVEDGAAEYVARGLAQIATALRRFDSDIDPEPFFALAALILERQVSPTP